jgi:alkanesulfonate monooxygenase SsuD/methylene tetrahydromethanopterin reductase-like flavin-dependent oxidoreductase (luciferase family)
MAATVAEASAGRFVLGYGTGNRKEYLQPLGRDYGRGADACRDAILTVRELLAGNAVERESHAFSANGVALSFEPAEGVDIYLAGIARKVLEVAGALADGVIVNFASPAGIIASLQHVERGRIHSSSTGCSEVVAWAVGIVTGDPSAEYDRMRPFVAHTIAPTADSTLRAVGLTVTEITRIRETYWSRGAEAAADHVTDKMIDHWCWIGRADQLTDRVLPLAELGVTEVAIIPFAGSLDGMVSTVRSFAEAVGPVLR